MVLAEPELSESAAVYLLAGRGAQALASIRGAGQCRRSWSSAPEPGGIAGG